MYLSRSVVLPLLSLSISERRILRALYDHTDRKERVTHRLAIFDFGTTNEKYFERNKNNVYAYAYDHLDDKTNLPNPKVIAFNIDSFLELSDSGHTFDPIELTNLHRSAAKYDYRQCSFALLPDRGWYK